MGIRTKRIISWLYYRYVFKPYKQARAKRLQAIAAQQAQSKQMGMDGEMQIVFEPEPELVATVERHVTKAKLH